MVSTEHKLSLPPSTQHMDALDPSSLLYEALHPEERADKLSNTLILDVFDVRENDLPSAIRAAESIQQVFSKEEYRFVLPPRIGIAKTEDIVHARVLIDYDVSIDDEWKAVQLLWSTEYAVSMHDVQDGNILCIQAAEAVPNWIDQDSARYSVWLYQQSICFVSTSEWLTALKNNDFEVASNAFLALIDRRINAIELRTHTATFRLPQAYAQLFSNNPDLVCHAVQKFHLSHQLPEGSVAEPPDEWIPISLTLPRLAFAKLKKLVNPVWPDEKFVPFDCKDVDAPTVLGCRLLAGLLTTNGIDDEPPLHWEKFLDANMSHESSEALSKLEALDSISPPQAPAYNLADNSSDWKPPPLRPDDEEVWMVLEQLKMKNVADLQAFFRHDDDNDEAIAVNDTKLLQVLHAAVRTESAEELKTELDVLLDPFFDPADFNNDDEMTAADEEEIVANLMAAWQDGSGPMSNLQHMQGL